MADYGLWPLSKGYAKDYNADFDPRITNEFATAAFRFLNQFDAVMENHSTNP